jgi:hypothetical protein
LTFTNKAPFTQPGHPRPREFGLRLGQVAAAPVSEFGTAGV